jgi:fructokinase
VKADIVALGECLIDFLLTESADKSKLLLEGRAGGAPANVLAMAAKLGSSAAFIGKVGRDAFGDYLLRCIGQSGVHTGAMVRGGEPTTLAMVALDEKGNRSFSFYRSQTADVMLHQREVDMEWIEGCRIFHFGSVSMTASPAKETTLAAAGRAKSKGARLSFDPNYRPPLWADAQTALLAMRQGLELADYVKLSDDEAVMLAGERDPEKAAAALAERYGFRFLAVTLGPAGCIGVSRAARVLLPTYDVTTVDTTGAGDAFWGAVLHRLLRADKGALRETAVADILAFGNAAGALATTRHGAIAAQPTEEEINCCIKTVKYLKN